MSKDTKQAPERIWAYKDGYALGWAENELPAESATEYIRTDIAYPPELVDLLEAIGLLTVRQDGYCFEPIENLPDIARHWLDHIKGVSDE